MKHWIAVALLEGILWTGPRLSPAEAAAILYPGRYVYVEARPRYSFPTVVVIGGSTGGPFGNFAPPTPARRLDGTPLSHPAWSVTTYVGRFGPRVADRPRVRQQESRARARR